MNARLRTRFKERLLDERAQAAHMLDVIATSVASAGATHDLFAAKREGCAGAVGGAFEDDVAVAAHETAALDDIDETLRLLNEEPDQYGKCRECGDPISAERLEF